jgi:hypothetical protein
MLKNNKNFYSKQQTSLDETGPKVLSFENLSFGFATWFGSCSLAVLSFVVEILNLKLKKKLGNLIGLMFLLYILRQRSARLIL